MKVASAGDGEVEHAAHTVVFSLSSAYTHAMASPFPGMNPYLEGYLCTDAHQSLAGQIKRQLSPLLRPRYVARLAVYFLNDLAPAHEVGIVYPDVEVVQPQQEPPVEAAGQLAATATMAITPPALILPATVPVEARVVSVHILDVAKNELVTSIEILSPANKREPGLSAYQQKRAELLRAGVHLLEVDLIRRGSRAWSPEGLPATPYVALLTRAHRLETEGWPIGLRDPLPILPVPLRAPDPDAPLDLQTAWATICEESDYDRTLDYRQPPPEPALSNDDMAWLDALLRNVGRRS